MIQFLVYTCLQTSKADQCPLKAVEVLKFFVLNKRPLPGFLTNYDLLVKLNL